jgi:hypothetical protein
LLRKDYFLVKHCPKLSYQESSNSKPLPQQEVKNEKEERALEIKRRIDEMKNKLNQNNR